MKTSECIGYGCGIDNEVVNPSVGGGSYNEKSIIASTQDI